jgi:hypothetical protein
MTCIGKDQIEVSLEKVVDWLLVEAGRFHRHGPTVGLFQPIAQLNQTLSHRSKGLDLFA